MKADVTAESRPAYPRHRIHTKIKVEWENAHKDQGSIQIFAVFCNKLVVMIASSTQEPIVEFERGIAGCTKEARKRGC